jgi:uncharacterized membrane protein YoaK (UPF0700 family)
MPEESPPAPGKAFVVVLVALIGGAVDGIGFVVLVKLFTAHMSGNTIASGVHFGQGDWADALHRFFPIPVFVAGVLSGALLSEFLYRRKLRSVHAVIFGLEALLLVVFLAGASAAATAGVVPREPAWRYYLLAALPALAMGVQNAAVRRTGAVRVRTTYITGMLTNAAEEAAEYLFALGSAARGREAARWPSAGRLLLYLGIWLAYFGGAVGGVWVQTRIGLLALWPPIAGLVVLILWDLAWPLWLLQPERHPDWHP